MNFLRLRAFAVVAELSHVGQAAERLGLTQPALSQQLRLLEREVGTALVRRVGRGIGLTEAGAAFLPEALAVLAQCGRAVTVAQRTARGEVGTIRIGYVASAMLEPALPRLLSAFRTEAPNTQLELTDMVVGELLLALERAEIEIAVAREPLGPVPADVRVAPLGEQKLIAVVPEALARRIGCPAPLRALADQPFILLRDPDGVGLAHQVQLACERAGFLPQVSLRVSNPLAIGGLVAAGLGVGLVPAPLRGMEMDGASFVPLLDEKATTSLAVLHRPSLAGPLVRRFLALLGRPAAK